MALVPSTVQLYNGLYKWVSKICIWFNSKKMYLFFNQGYGNYPFRDILQISRLKLSEFNPSLPSISCKIKLNFYFHTFRGASKGFMKAFKAFIKPFEVPQSSVNIKV